MRIEIHDGPASRAEVLPLFGRVYPPEVLRQIVWRDVTAAAAERRIILRDDAGDVVAAAGLIARTATWNGLPVRIGGVGGVMVEPHLQRQGLGRIILEATHAALRSDAGLGFGLLFCEARNLPFYRRLGWQLFGGDIRAEQPGGPIDYRVMPAMTLALAGPAPENGQIDLRGLPW